MKAVGNAKSNEVYEELLPQDFDRESLRKDNGRLEFITDKYVNMKYTSQENKERIRQESRSSRVTTFTNVPKFSIGNDRQVSK